MATNKNRLAQLEKAHGAGEVTKYLCTSYAEDKEYIAKPFGGVTGEALVFKTEDAMTAYFDKRKDLELIHICVIYASEADTPIR